MTPRTRIGLSLALLAVAVGCERGDDPRGEPSAAAGTRRTFTSAAWDTLWVVGGAESDTLLQYPLYVAAGGGHVYVGDNGAFRVVSLRASDGALEWVAGRKGSGPGELLSITALEVTPAGEVVVADSDNGRLMVLDARGRVVRHVRLGGIPYVQSVCAREDGTMLLSTASAGRPVVRVGADGSVLDSLALPWPETARMPGIALQAWLARAGEGGECVAALFLGLGFTTLGGRTAGGPHPYVEEFGLPPVEVTGPAGQRTERLRQRRIAARAVAAVADETDIAFEGESAERGRIIDRYDARGRYRGSLLFPRRIDAMDRAGPTYFLLHKREGYPVLVAAAPRPAERRRE